MGRLDVHIRQARPDDVECITALGAIPELAFGEAQYNLPQHYLGRMPNDLFLVAELEGMVVGFIMAEPLMMGGVLVWMAGVDPAHRGHGIGTALFSALNDAARARGSRWMYGCMSTKNPRLRGYYERLGFEFGQELVEVLTHLERPGST